MKKMYSVDIEVEKGTHPIEEDYEKNGDNLIRIEVFDKSGVLINSTDLYCVQITFSRSGALGFGKELIRSSFNSSFDRGFHHHIEPINQEVALQAMGVNITSDSPELVVKFGSLGNIAAEQAKLRGEIVIMDSQ